MRWQRLGRGDFGSSSMSGSCGGSLPTARTCATRKVGGTPVNPNRRIKRPRGATEPRFASRVGLGAKEALFSDVPFFYPRPFFLSPSAQKDARQSMMSPFPIFRTLLRGVLVTRLASNCQQNCRPRVIDTRSSPRQNEPLDQAAFSRNPACASGWCWIRRSRFGCERLHFFGHASFGRGENA